MKILLHRICFVLVAAVAINAAYLAAFDSPSIFYYANVIAHVVLGFALATGLLLAGIGMLITTDGAMRPAGDGPLPGPSLRVSWFIASAAAAMSLSGIYLARTGTSSVHVTALRAHMATAEKNAASRWKP